MTGDFVKDFIDARRTNVPLLVIETADPGACMAQIASLSKKAAIVCWDKSEGLTFKNQLGEKMLSLVLGARQTNEDTGQLENSWGRTDPEVALREASKFLGKNNKLTPAGSILFVMNGHTFLNSNEYTNAHEVRQATYNLRDPYKKDFRMVIFLCPSIELPEELKHDVVVLDHPMPTNEELAELTKTIYSLGDVKADDPKIFTNIGQEMKGVSKFEAEQILSMSLTPAGMDMQRLWLFKKKTLEQTPGLKIFRPEVTFNDIHGMSNLKDYGSMIMESDNAPTIIVFMDEIEKQLSGTGEGGNDSTMQEMHGQMLSWTADEEILALLETGQPGCGKSIFAKALAGQYKKLMAVLNLSEVKSKYVGTSTNRLKNIFKTLTSIGKPLLIATSNNIGVLSPELRDRFNLGIYFVDFPNKDGRKLLWKQYTEKYGVKNEVNFDDDLWSPRNIRDCTANAAMVKSTLEVASRRIVPVKLSDPKSIDRRRMLATGRFLSSEYPGVYKYEREQEENEENASEAVRTIEFGERIGEQ